MRRPFRRKPPKGRTTLTREVHAAMAKNIFTNGVYHGSDDVAYSFPISTSSMEQIITLVKFRADEDGQYAIDNNLVGDNVDKMRRLMAYVADPENIARNVNAHLDRGEKDLSIDFICRDLANGAKWTWSRSRQ